MTRTGRSRIAFDWPFHWEWLERQRPQFGSFPHRRLKNLAAALTVTVSAQDIRLSVVKCRGINPTPLQSHPRRTLASLGFQAEDESLKKQDGQTRALPEGPSNHGGHRIWVVPVFDAVFAPQAPRSLRMEWYDWAGETQSRTEVETPHCQIVLPGVVMRNSLGVIERLSVMGMAAVLDIASHHHPMKEEDTTQLEAVVIAAGEAGFDTTAYWPLVVVSLCKHSGVERRCGLEAES